MNRSARCLLLFSLIAVAPVCLAGKEAKKPQLSAEESAVVEQLQALQSEVGPAKREWVKAQLGLTPEEEKRFWPVYEEHQKALEALNKRRLDNILAYSRVYNAGHIESVPANRMIREAISIEKAEAELMDDTFDKLRGWLEPTKLVTYLQIEAKLRAYVRIKQASQVPLAK
jgi:hypothetical protein